MFRLSIVRLVLLRFVGSSICMRTVFLSRRLAIRKWNLLGVVLGMRPCVIIMSRCVSVRLWRLLGLVRWLILRFVLLDVMGCGRL